VRESGSRLGFATESFNKIGVNGVLRKQHLQRNRTIKQNVMSKEYLGHTATTNAALNAISVVD
jgi:hypothetical protein